MKKNINVVQIKGVKGILCVALIGCCLAAGFIWFPGWVCLKLWNILSLYVTQIPTIGIFQGLLLWGIIAGSYYTFRKEKHVVCFKSAEGLNEEELKEVFADMKRQAKDEAFLRTILKAREAELKIKNLSESNIPQSDVTENKDKVESK